MSRATSAFMFGRAREEVMESMAGERIGRASGDNEGGGDANGDGDGEAADVGVNVEQGDDTKPPVHHA